MFYNPDDFEWLADFQQHFNDIKEELNNIKNLPPQPLYKNTWGNEDRPTYLNKDENPEAQWTTFVFKFFAIKHIPNSKSCPKTAALIEKYPQIITAEFSMIQPNTHILPHTGYSGLYYRAHLPLDIPQGDLGFKVDGITKRWEENQWLVFDDSKIHEAWNKSNQPRTVLLIDFIPPHENRPPKTICKQILTQTNDPFIFNTAPKELWLKWVDDGAFPLSPENV